MNRKKLLLFIVIIFILPCLYQIFFGVKEISLKNNVKLMLLRVNEGDYCNYIPASESNPDGVYFKFEYQKKYKPNLSFFNLFVLRERFKKEKIVSLTFESYTDDKINIIEHLSNYINRGTFQEYLTQEYINPIAYNLKENQNSKFVYDEYIRPKEKIIENYSNINEIFKELCIEVPSICSDLKSIKFLKLINPNKHKSFKSENGIYCPNLLPNYTFMEESYVGNIDFFIKLYNQGYLEQNANSLYPGFLMKINLNDEVINKFFKKNQTVKLVFSKS